jgi:hypothetical protein
MRLPTKRGAGNLPRYGGGWMYQFGHTYLLQQELLNKNNADWFRAIELWHTARHEGLALNISHYTNILQHTLIETSSVSEEEEEFEEKENNHDENKNSTATTWTVALDVLRQMRRDAIRADCRSVSMALNILANHARWEEALTTFGYFSLSSPSSTSETKTNKNISNNSIGKYSGVGMRLDSVCVAATIRACMWANRETEAESFVSNLRNIHNKSNKNFSVCPSVDAITIDAALEELQQQQNHYSNQLQDKFLEGVESEKKLMISSDEQGGETSGKQFEEEEVVLISGRKTNKEENTKMFLRMENNNKQELEAVEKWKKFFEKVSSKK